MPAGVSAKVMERLTAAAFGQRRKMLRQSLKGLPGALDALETLGIDPQRRAETLTVGDYVAIGRIAQFFFGVVAGGLAWAKVGPRAMAAFSSAACGQPAVHNFCSFARTSLARAEAPCSTIAAP